MLKYYVTETGYFQLKGGLLTFVPEKLLDITKQNKLNFLNKDKQYKIIKKIGEA